MLWACIYLPQLPLEVFTHSQPLSRPLAIEETINNKRLVTYANPTAIACGIEKGITTHTAHSLAENLQMKNRDPNAEHKILEQLAVWAYQFTPHINIYQENSLLMELEGSLRLFGGQQPLNTSITRGLHEQGYVYKLAYCKTPLSSTLLAKSDFSPTRAGAFHTMETTHQCDLSLMDVRAKTIERLKGMGFSKLGDILHLPPSTLGKRFGTGFSNYLQRLTGKMADPRPSFQLPDRFSEHMDFIEELTSTQMLLFPLKRLLVQLENFLVARQLCISSMTVIFHDRHQQAFTIQISPGRQHYRADHFLSLLRLRMENIRLQQPVISLTVKAERFTPLRLNSNDLFGQSRHGEADKHELVDKLKARLGDERVRGLSLSADHRPEKSWETTSPGTVKDCVFPANNRPIWLLENPQRLKAKKGNPVYGGPLQLLQGPERIETGWWDHAPVNRDYFIARHPCGQRYWIYQDRGRQNTWFLHGIFG
jgi:protein ImuB